MSLKLLIQDYNYISQGLMIKYSSYLPDSASSVLSGSCSVLASSSKPNSLRLACSVATYDLENRPGTWVDIKI